MFDFSNLIINAAHAADAVAPSSDSTFGLMRFLPLFLIFGVFYVLLIRPQQKKLDEQNAMIKALKRGDRVVTAGGLVGKVASVEGDEYVMLTVAEGVQVKVVRSTIASLVDANKQDGKPDKAAGK